MLPLYFSGFLAGFLKGLYSLLIQTEWNSHQLCTCIAAERLGADEKAILKDKLTQAHQASTPQF
jgi:hypothetical protein